MGSSDNKRGQIVRRLSKAEKMTVIIFLTVALGGITLIAYLDSREWDVIFIPIVTLVISSPVWLVARRSFNQTYFEDNDHFETVTRVLNRPVSMRFDEIESIEPSYNAGYIWVRSVTGQRVELYYNSEIMPRLAHIYHQRIDAERNGPFSSDERALPWYARLFGRNTPR